MPSFEPTVSSLCSRRKQEKTAVCFTISFSSSAVSLLGYGSRLRLLHSFHSDPFQIVVRPLKRLSGICPLRSLFVFLLNSFGIFCVTPDHVTRCDIYGRAEQQL